MNNPTLLHVIKAPNKLLRVPSQAVGVVNDSTRKLIEDMFHTIDQHGSIGLAATQVGRTERVIVVDVEPLDADGEDTSNVKSHGRLAIVNPKLVESRGSSIWTERCMSVPGQSGKVERSTYIKVQGLNENGENIEVEAFGLLSCCLQHEIDHLDGKLFFDRLSRVKRDILLRKMKKYQKRVLGRR